MIIRNAEKKDIERILEVFASAKAYMRKNGNTKQWADSYPDTETILEDIKEKQFYVMEEDNCIHGVFAFIIGEDPTYRIIENGEWKSDTLYGTIHRLASTGYTKNVFHEVMNFCLQKISHIRADTHEDNLIMQNLLLKEGFEECGIIYVRDHTLRKAYQYLKG